MELNYKLIGGRIRDFRKEMGLSQEQLAEATGYTANHISHVEVGSTKLSLASLVSIANVLEVTPDRLLSDVIFKSEELLKADFSEVLKDCNSSELYIILQTAKTIKEAIRIKNLQ